jgi:glycosyltransferase involved in cell wall biosynthesis
MKIAQVAPLFESVPPKLYGGTERVVSWLTEALVSQGHEVTLFASGDSKTSARLIPACPRALRLRSDCSDQLAHHYVMLDDVLQHAEEFDIIHFHSDYLHFPLSRSANLPHVTTVHGRLDLRDLVPLYRKFRDLPLISISLAQRKPLCWANWVGNAYHGMPEDQLSLRDGSGKYLAFLGRVSPEKRLDRAIHIALETGMPLKIAAKVDRVDRDYYESKIKPLLVHPSIQFLGEISDREKNEFLGNAYALLFPVDWPEPFGLVMIEAMACGTPIIAFRCGSVPEIIRPGVSGFIVDDLAEAVAAVPQVSTLSRKTCRWEFELRFTASRMAKDYVKLYEAVLAARSGTEEAPEVDSLLTL